MPLTEEEKEKKRKKQYKRMGKILGKIWNLDIIFQDRNANSTICLTDIGKKIDTIQYKFGKHGWENFAYDIGCVYNYHIQKKTKYAAVAKKHCKAVHAALNAVDESLAKLAKDAKAPDNIETVSTTTNKNHKRKASSSETENGIDNENGHNANKKRKKNHSNKNSDLAAREERALEQLENFIEEHGADKQAVAGFRSRVTRKGTRYDTCFYNEAGRRFRSMVEVGRFLNIVDQKQQHKVKRKNPRNTTREQEAEKKRIRKELERLRKTLQRTTKQLDEFRTNDNDNTRYPIDDRMLTVEDINYCSMKSRASCAAALIPDMTGFPGIPKHCTPDVLMTWDFLCTFDRALNLTSIALDDFASALVYVPPAGQMGDDVVVPPVYLAEAHLGLLKLLFSDISSDEWWWSTLETDETEGIKVKAEELEEDKEDSDKPVIKINIASMLAEVEDPLITNSWLSSLEKIKSGTLTNNAITNCIKTALKVVSNKWVAAYLRKALDISKASGANLTQRAIRWLVNRVREARPDLGERSSSQDAVYKARAKVVEDANKQMESLGTSAPIVNDEDAVSDFEYEEEEDSDDESDDEDVSPDDEEGNGQKDSRDESEKPASALPPKPLPTFVDLLLPPTKPHPNSDFVDAFSWPHLLGATATRVIHRKKRILNEVDDSIREAQALPQLKVSERREREKYAVSRILTECVDANDHVIEQAAEHLCQGGNYLDLSSTQRLALLRLMIEAAYDTIRVHEVVNGNYKQRTSAMKALDVEQRRAKREAKEKAAADEAAAREQLANEAKIRFFDEKREEIRRLNDKSKEFSDEVIESLTDEDIIDFDEDFKADFEALPAPESFSKSDVAKMVERLQEEAAFDTDAFRVLTMEELVEREKMELEEMEGQLAGFGGEEALQDESLDRETIRSIERLRKDIERSRILAETLPSQREKALDQLRDAMEDGTIKVLRAAYTAAKKAKLVGTDDETGGVWALDLMRDAALELEKAKQNKRVLDAQKDLVAKRNRCFIRTEPIGRDRFGNRFWMFGKKNSATDENGQIWVDAEFIIKKDGESYPEVQPGFLDLVKEPTEISFGAKDQEEDFVPKQDKEAFERFSRREYHYSGFTPTLARHHWGCHATEDALRAVIKNLSSRGIREKELKAHLKETVEETVGTGEKPDAKEGSDEEDIEEGDGSHAKTEGDEAVFIEAKDASKSDEEIDSEAFESLTTAIGSKVRVRTIVDDSKDPPIARYENGKVNAWKTRMEEVEIVEDNDESDYEEEFGKEKKYKTVEVPIWRVATERGHTYWLSGADIMQSLSRFKRFNEGHGYFEHDSAFFSYRNSLGKFCGRAAEAAYSASPFYFAKLMIKREGEIYPKLKSRSYDNSWGGQSGARALWMNSMKDYAYDFETVKQGLLTLENAFFDLTGQFTDYVDAKEPDDVEALLKDPDILFDIELESLEKNLPGLWNSPTSRAVFLHVVKNSKTTGFLSLALDLLYRNTMQYLQAHKLLNVRGEKSEPLERSTRATRRKNAWQQQQGEAWF